jgi:hypothetical protein
MCITFQENRPANLFPALNRIQVHEKYFTTGGTGYMASLLIRWVRIMEIETIGKTIT